MKKVFKSAYLNEYKEIKKIGEGGTSTVYKVLYDDKEYALKLLDKKITKEGKKRFKNEMDFCSRTEHSNIIKIVDNGIINIDGIDYMFYVMPLYNKNLREMIKDGIPHDLILYYFNMILEAVKFFHNGHNFHRDIKPENILFDENSNKMILADFGISHFYKDDLYTVIETKPNSRMANFQYASPEQREKGSIIDNKSDIYALGLILNEMFTKNVPNGSDFIKIKDIDCNYAFLDDIVDNMIKQNKDDRYKDIETIQYELRVRLDIRNQENEIKKLKEIEFSQSDETDILILDPPKLIDVIYDDIENRLRFKLSHPINQLWVDSIKSNSWSSLFGYDVEQFSFEREYASVSLSIDNLNSGQKIIDNFKGWIDNANREYPNKVMRNRELYRIRKENEIKSVIQRKEKINKAVSEFKF